MKERRPLSVLLALALLVMLLAFAYPAYAAPGIQISTANFPDEVFRTYVLSKCDTDHNGSLSEEEIAAVTEIKFSSAEVEEKLTSLQGIEYFTALETLHCNGNLETVPITSVDLSHNTALKQLQLSKTDLTALDLSANAALEVLLCGYSYHLAELDVTGCPELRTLDVSYDSLTELVIRHCPKLNNLEAYWNGLTELDISACPLLMEIYLTATPVSTRPAWMLSSESEIMFPYYWEYKNETGRLSVNKDVPILTEAPQAAISFDPDGGSGTMEAVNVPVGEKYALPDCGFTAPEGKEFDKWDVGTPGEEIEVTADLTVKAIWKEKPTEWAVSFDADGGSGTMEAAKVPVGEKYTLPDCGFTAPEGKEFDKWDAGAPGEEIEVTADLTVKAVWKEKPTEWAVSFDADGGSGTMEAAKVPVGKKYTLPDCGFIAPEGKEFDKWDAGAPGDEIEITADRTVKAVWKDKPAETWMIVFDGNGGTGEMASVAVEKGKSYVLPDCGFTAPKGKVFDRWNKGEAGETIEVSANMALFALWKNEAIDPFRDVREDDYCYSAVLWAYTAKPFITNGKEAPETAEDGTVTNPGLFGTADTVTRGQAVTFLWRAMGEPEPASTDNPFVDVWETDYWFKAIMWAVEKGIVKGTDATHYTPYQTCSTAHMVTFLFRTLGIGIDGWYEEAGNWAAEKGLLNGTGLEVSRTADCPRGAVVTFLYRALVKE